MAEIWFRHPDRCLRDIVRAGSTKVVWHQGRVFSKRIDPVPFLRHHFPAGVEWRSLIVGGNGAVEHDHTSAAFNKPVAVYPVWTYGEDMEKLIQYLEHPIPGYPYEPIKGRLIYRPREGQERRIVIIRPPGLTTGLGRRFHSDLGDLQEQYPETKLHLFEASSFRGAFGFGLASADLDVTIYSAYAKVLLPNGKKIHIDDIGREHYQWLHLLGFSPDDLVTKSGRNLFNARSAMWAAEHYVSPDARFRTIDDGVPVDPDALDVPERPTKISKSWRFTPMVGDLIQCDQCSMFDRCKYARVGGVCTVPGSETANLAKYFRTRDSERIMDGLGELLAVQAERVERAMEWEASSGAVSDELTKVITQMFDGAVKLAKLANPALAATGPKIALQINTAGGPTQVTAANPKSLMAAIVGELEASGIPRDQITPEMIMKAVGGPQPEPIEVQSHDAA